VWACALVRDCGHRPDMARNAENTGRHGSTESSDSWRSQDTIKPSMFGSGRRGIPMKVNTNKDKSRREYVRFPSPLPPHYH